MKYFIIALIVLHIIFAQFGILWVIGLDIVFVVIGMAIIIRKANEQAKPLYERIKVGEILYSTEEGRVEVISISDNSIYPIYVKCLKNRFSFYYSKEGKFTMKDKHPELFKNKDEAIEYYKLHQLDVSNLP